jgi:hypothetical protein
LAGRVQFGKQDAVQLIEDSGLLPPLQAAPAGLSGAEPQLQRQEALMSFLKSAYISPAAASSESVNGHREPISALLSP